MLLDIWYDRWLLDSPLIEVVPTNDPPHMLLVEFYGDGGWKVSQLKSWLPDPLVQQIQKVDLYPNQDHHMVWAVSPSGLFTTKSAWDLIRQKRIPSLLDDLLWSNVVPLKMSFLAWKVVRNLIPVETNLKKRGIPMASRCLCCLSHEETLGHLFVMGPVATEVWGIFQRRFGILEPQPFLVSGVFSLWFGSSPAIMRGHIRTIIPILIFWFIWKSRNRARFDGICLEACGVVSSIASFVEQLGLANKLSKRLFRGDYEDPWAQLGVCLARHIEVTVVSWKRPPQFYVKLNTDGSVTQNRAYRGGLLRDSDGRLLFAFHKEFGDIDVLGTESLALLHGLRLCTGLVTGSLLVEVESKSLVRLLQAGGVEVAVVQYIKEHKQSFCFIVGVPFACGKRSKLCGR
ncbi:uncharacterized protein [Coffea arabica]|uniref:Reverse transcriptase zinc-binding domain-containing protein n=1 Tax=Coffea arabica TaxID=13443 RepID=A0A6P6T1F2_COFAR|nr:uncharacterized protein LOC113696660 [Coffea arabica]